VVLLTEGDTAQVQTICQQVLPKYHQPKVYLHIDKIPLTETGKPARKEAEELAK
jgi:O-succinylbenzoic acid--CoA ligase